MTKNKVDIDGLLKIIKKNVKYIEATEKYLRDLEEIENGFTFLDYTFQTRFNEQKEYTEQLKKRLICDHENTHEENDYDYHNDIDYIKIVCNDCGFIVEE